MANNNNNPGPIKYDPGPIRIEASQKGWLLVRSLSELLHTITCIEAMPDHDWLAYYTAKKKAIDTLKQFEVWHGKES